MYLLVGDDRRWWASISHISRCAGLDSFWLRMPLSLRSTTITWRGATMPSTGWTLGTHLDVCYDAVSYLPHSLKVLGLVLEISSYEYIRDVGEIIARIKWGRIQQSITRLPGLRGVSVELAAPNWKNDNWPEYITRPMVESFRSGPIPLMVGA